MATSGTIDLLNSAALDSQRLRAERSAGRVRSNLHGIPIIAKNNFATHPDLGMDTTCGTMALRGVRPKRGAVVIVKLIEAGMIVIGTASLSSVGGSDMRRNQDEMQVLMATIQTPCGSSSYSAIGVAAGFASGLSDELPRSWTGFKVGFLNFRKWRLSPNETEEVESFDTQTFVAFDDAVARLCRAGLSLEAPLELLTVEEIAEMENGADFDDIANDGWRSAFDAWLADFESSPVRNIEELVQFHKDHADICFPPDHPFQAPRCLKIGLRDRKGTDLHT
ncbi:hypothetical protein B0H67DRAFT_547665 [Lasiosphaeris hirsuta]|uniref:Amidase domain-containing protein n=1 Tax=Lasiosphaeris hirsuta TaxID=260670 RepID=A0AA40E778_9PEZI|nr:hypothetical protein B0H67DRAFT_547665 [Lasiosphaeris hirsuta]